MSTPEPVLGIDYGTCNSVMAWVNPKTGQAEIIRNAEGDEQTPSLVHFSPDEVIVGKHAVHLLEDEQARDGIYPPGAKRNISRNRSVMLGGKLRNPFDVAVAILGKLKNDAEQGHFRATVPRAVITVPATFDPVERDRVREAGRQAGFTQVELLDEPVAAALAYARDGLAVGRRVLVSDLGAGTFDLALLAHESGEFEPVLPPRGLRQGGDDFDQALYDHLERQAKQQDRPWSVDGQLDLHLLRRCREIKENLSGSREVIFSVILSDGKPFKCSLNRSTLESLIEPVVRLTVEETERMLAEAKAAGHEVDTVVLVGGSTRVPLVEERLRSSLPFAPVRWQRRDVAVALGAAYRAVATWAKPVPAPALARQPITLPSPTSHKPTVERVQSASGTSIRTVEELVYLCETNTEAAERALKEGEFERRLAVMGRDDLAKRAWKARVSRAPDRECLIWFLDLGAIPGGPGLAARLLQLWASNTATVSHQPASIPATPPTPASSATSGGAIIRSAPSADVQPSSQPDSAPNDLATQFGTVGAVLGAIVGALVGMWMAATADGCLGACVVFSVSASIGGAFGGGLAEKLGKLWRGTGR